MSLTITAMSYRGCPVTNRDTVFFSLGGGTLGRAPDNDLVLSDPDKVISRYHSTISCKEGEYYLTDTSLAGTVIANRNITLHKHTANDTAHIEDGDIIQIGDYQLIVSISEMQAPSPPLVNPTHESFPSSTLPDNAVNQGDLDLERLLVSGKSPEPDIYGQPAPNQSVDPSFGDNLRVPVQYESFTPPAAASAHPPEPKQDPADFDLQELLNSLKQPEGLQDPDDFPEIPPPLADRLSAPEPEPPKPEPFESEAAPVIKPSPPAEPIAAPTPVVAAPPPVPQQSSEQPDSPVQLADTDHNNELAELTSIFLKAAGIDGKPSLQLEEMRELMKVAGSLVKEMTDSLMLMLRGRMEMKNQFRVSRTILRTTDNNPLKFSLTAADALSLLLIEKKPGFLPAEEAVRQGCRDIMKHELAVTAANQAALIALLKQFDPCNFSKQFEEGFVLQKKSKCWDKYCQSYPELIKNAQNNFYSEDFVCAYEKQMQQLQSVNVPGQRHPVGKSDE